MPTPPGKYKTTITIWTDYCASFMELVDLAYEATEGSAICTDQESVYVENPELDPEYEGAAEFFSNDDDDDLELIDPTVDPWLEPDTWLEDMFIAAQEVPTVTVPEYHYNCMSCGRLIYIDSAFDDEYTYAHLNHVVECDITDPFGDFAWPVDNWVGTL